MPWGAVAGAVIGVAGNALLSGGQQSQQSSQQQMPAWMQDQWQNTINQSNAAANRNSNQAVAPLNANQNAAFQNAQRQYGTGQVPLQQVQNSAASVVNSGIQPSMQQFMSPYTSQVVNTTLGQMQQQENQQNAAINSQATAANAFGGDRAAVAQALNSQQWTNAMGQTAASLNNQGFMNAGQLATNNVGLQLQGNQQLQNSVLAAQQLQMQQNQNLLSAGNQQQTQAQNVANWPIQQAQIMGSALNPGVGGSVNSSGQYSSYMSPVQSGLMGAQLGNNLLNYYNGQNSLNNYMTNTVNPGVDSWIGGYTSQPVDTSVY